MTSTISDVWIAPIESRGSSSIADPHGGVNSRLWWLAVVPAILYQLFRAITTARVATPFEDEGLYVYEGHQMIAHILHGYFIPEYPGSYFSGSPGVYPVLAALGDHFDGLTGARFVSTIFAIVATLATFGLARELFDGLAATVAVSLFVTAGPVIFLSTFATYDMMMLACALVTAWCAVVAMRRNLLLHAPSVALLMALTFFVKYAGAVYTPLIGILALSVGWPLYRWLAVRQVTILVLLSISFTLALLATVERPIVPGVVTTTLSRKALAPGSTREMLSQAFQFDGYWYIAGAVGVGLCCVFCREKLWVVAALSLVALGPMADQIRIHELTSWSKHVAFGVPFAAMVAGAGVSGVCRSVIWSRGRVSEGRFTIGIRMLPLALTLVAICMIAPYGESEAKHSLSAWPNDSKLVAVLRTVFAQHPGRPILGESPSPERYALANVISGAQWKDTYQLFYKRKTGYRAYRAAIRSNYFGEIYLSYGTVYGRYVASIVHQGDYHLVARVPRVLRGKNIGDWFVFELAR